MAHVQTGTTVEIAAPLHPCSFSTNKWLNAGRGWVVDGRLSHLFIISTFPLAVPLEWKRGLRLHHDLPCSSVSRTGMDTPPWKHVAALAGSRHRRRVAFFFPVLGNLPTPTRSPSCLRYGSTRATGPPAVWAFAPGAETKARPGHPLGTGNQVDQFIDFGYEPHWAEITAQRTIAWRTMHSQGAAASSRCC